MISNQVKFFCISICYRHVTHHTAFAFLSLIQLSVSPSDLSHSDSLVNKGQNEMILNYRSLYNPEPSLQIKIAFDLFTFTFTPTNQNTNHFVVQFRSLW